MLWTSTNCSGIQRVCGNQGRKMNVQKLSHKQGG